MKVGKASYVEHPRWGSEPRRTGLDVSASVPGVFLHWNTQPLGGMERAIPGTAVAADLQRQTPATVQVTHYYDVERRCRGCGRLFLFFAIEQKHWYEELGFPLEADCVRCHPCRRRTRELQQLLRRYQELLRGAEPSLDEELELALCRLELIESAVFPVRQADLVRAFLNRRAHHPRAAEIRTRLEEVLRGA